MALGESPGNTETVARSRDERGTCKAVLPLRVVPGARYVPFLFLSYCCWAFYLTVVGLSINSWKCSI